MAKETIQLTRTMQLKVDAPTKEERKEALVTLYRWQNRSYRAANLIITHLYIQEMIKEFFYLTEDIQYKLADQKKVESGILNRSRINTTYRVIADRFKGEIPMEILSNLNRNLESSFNKNKPKYWKGERSLKNFRRDIGFPFPARCMWGFKHDPERNAFCFRLFQIPFCTYLGRDFSECKGLQTKSIKFLAP